MSKGAGVVDSPEATCARLLPSRRRQGLVGLGVGRVCILLARLSSPRESVTRTYSLWRGTVKAPNPTVVVFDVNETLSDMSSMVERFVDVGAPEPLAKLWFASLLRDGFALTAAGTSEQFARLGKEQLRVLLHGAALDRSLEAAVDHVMAGFMRLPLHPDVVRGVQGLRQAGLRLVTLTNGSTQVAANLFDEVGIRDEFEALLSVEDAGTWKPARAAYEYAATVCATAPAEMLLVAVHPWDIEGAARAGMSTAWVNRSSGPYPKYFTAPTYVVSSLTELVSLLTR